MGAETLRVITGALIAMEGCRERYLAEGRRFARLIAENVDPGESEAHRQAVEDAQDVLEHFEEDVLKAGADDATVDASIATLMTAAFELLGPVERGVLADAFKGTTFEGVARSALRKVQGVEAVFLAGDRTLDVVAREHEDVDRGALLEAEERLSRFGDVELHVRAHQGRGVAFDAMGKRIL